MKDTQIEIKHRKLHKEGYLQKIPAEQGKYAEVQPSRFCVRKLRQKKRMNRMIA